MPRQTHTVGRRLRESETLMLVADLLRRGARTKTVERLTGLNEVPIRDVYREIFGSSPQKGPSGYSHTYFTMTQITQFHSTLAQACIEIQYKARPDNSPDPQAPELGALYCILLKILFKIQCVLSVSVIFYSFLQKNLFSLIGNALAAKLNSLPTHHTQNIQGNVIAQHAG
jgi:Flagellar transcriptional activator (FlhC)